MTRGSSLDYGDGTISYCPAPPHPAGPAKEEKGGGCEGGVVNDTAALRFTPTPVTHDHPVQPFQLLFSTVPLTLEPPPLPTTVPIDGWEWSDEEADAGAEEPRLTTPDEEGGPLLSSLRVDQTDVLPISIRPQSELRQHWKTAHAGDVVRYTLRPAAASSSPSQTAIRSAAVEPGMDEVDVMELLSVDNRADWSPCVLYAVEGGNTVPPVPANRNDGGEGDDAVQLQKIESLPFAFSPSTQIRFRVDLTKLDVMAEMQRWLAAATVAATQNTSADTLPSEGFPPICTVGFRARQRGSTAFSSVGVVRVEWAAAPRTAVEAENIFYTHSSAQRTLHVSARAAVKSGVSGGAFHMKDLCLATPPSIPNLDLSVSSFPYCVPCAPDEHTCKMKLSYGFKGNNTTTTPEPASVSHNRNELEGVPEKSSALDDLMKSYLGEARHLHFFTVSAHSKMRGEYISGGARVKVQFLSEQLLNFIDRYAGVAEKVVHINRTSEVPVVVDVFSVVPVFLRSFIDSVTVDGGAIDRLSGQLYGAASAPFSSSFEARRGLQWQRLLPGSYVSFKEMDALEPTKPRATDTGQRRALKLNVRHTLLRYVPPASWLSIAPCATTANSATAVRDTVDMKLHFAFAVVGKLSLIFVTGPHPTCPPRTPAPLESEGRDGWRAPTRTLTPIRAHRFVYQHTANPLQLPLADPSRTVDEHAPPSSLPVEHGAHAIRFVSLPRRGSVSRVPSCDNIGSESESLLGHCNAMPSHPPLDAETGCVCCLQECSAHVGGALSAGAILEADRPADTSFLDWFSPFWVFYTPPSSTSTAASSSSPAGNAVTVEDEEVGEVVVVICYTTWPVRHPVQLYELVLHIRRWPDTALRPSFLLPLASDAGPAAAAPPSLSSIIPQKPMNSGSVFRVLQMSARADVETGLLTGAPDNATTWMSDGVFECVPLRREGVGEGPLRASYARSTVRLVPTWKFGAWAFWPSVTRGCVVLETDGDLPTLFVRAVRVDDANTSVVAASTNGDGGKRAGTVVTRAASPLAFATLQLQPYASALPEQANVTWTSQVDAASSHWPVVSVNASAVVHVRVPSPWGFYHAEQTIQPFHITIRFVKRGDEGSDVRVRLSRAPRRGCVVQLPEKHCVPLGSSLREAVCESHGTSTTSSPSLWCVSLTYVLQRMEPNRPVRMHDVVELAAVTSDGQRVSKPLVISLEGKRPVVGGYLKQGILCLVVLLLIAVVTLPRRTLRSLTTGLASVQRRLRVPGRTERRTARGITHSYEMVGMHDDARQERI
ncbi:hypothetical protein ABB37_03290 [Leptomonas pyrrhocoris]|uniref:Transmembrane protein n=1 Tax=Leptomonas pyrrhocoris TaxID=157538 RepID=A0A0N0VFZ4_LEPPY|nr:hypothetical protein ABB37_03290 [Leptomonas pyrrhocoris]KPA82161.1 hypothetical protein ABB37_03290 [Leptomonas pyrrhocoris]|eukprot:XP_015660600.1 hypothetical protein ABB37_03290 [Leptomonas pyrrhocoris]